MNDVVPLGKKSPQEKNTPTTVEKTYYPGKKQVSKDRTERA
jgi:hypothetical protein